jgi:hypothetical protein
MFIFVVLLNYGFSGCNTSVVAKVCMEDLWTPRCRVSLLSVAHHSMIASPPPPHDLQPRNEEAVICRGSRNKSAVRFRVDQRRLPSQTNKLISYP